jgi:hypothetical protein
VQVEIEQTTFLKSCCHLKDYLIYTTQSLLLWLFSPVPSSAIATNNDLLRHFINLLFHQLLKYDLIHRPYQTFAQSSPAQAL